MLDSCWGSVDDMAVKDVGGLGYEYRSVHERTCSSNHCMVVDDHQPDNWED